MNNAKLFLGLMLTTMLWGAGAVSAADIAPPPVPTYEATNSDFWKALTGGTFSLDTRLRNEYVDQKGLGHNSVADTLRTRLGYTTGVFDGFKIGGELENLSIIGNNKYNNGYSGNTHYPKIADATGSRVNQAFIAYDGFKDTEAKVGRQVINLDDQRFIGESAWRQNNRTFDAAGIHTTYFKNADLYYAFFDQVNQTTGDAAPDGILHGRSTLVNGSYTFDPLLKLTGFAYFLDLGSSAPSSSVNTFGGHLTGKTTYDGLDWTYLAEAATENTEGQRTKPYSLGFERFESSVGKYGVTLKGGYELSQGNGAVAFQTPLYSPHSYNGWVGQFSSSKPANGLEDGYVSAAYKIPNGPEWAKGTEFTVTYHTFDAERISQHYGSEWDVGVIQTFYKYYTAGFEVGEYQAKHFGTNTTKSWAWVGMKF